jgi:hypothetical protein
VIDGMASTYGDRGLVVLGVNLWQSQGILKKFQKKYPNILVLRDPGTVWDVYKLKGYIPLNYVVGPDFKQIVAYSAEGFNHTAIQDQVLDLLSPVSVKIDSAGSGYPVGTQLGLSVEFTNHETTGTSFYALIDVAFPSGSYYPLFPLTLYILSASEVKTIPIDFLIPQGTPLGTYNLRVRIGMEDLWYREDLEFEIVK